MATRNARLMILEKERLKTFSNWVYNNESKVACTAEKMAKAGFYTISDEEPETVKCFVCMKQLDGWERNDDPFKEHEKHAPYCPFIKLGREEKNITLNEHLSLSEEMEKKLLEHEHQNHIKILESKKDEVIKALRLRDAQTKLS